MASDSKARATFVSSLHIEQAIHENKIEIIGPGVLEQYCNGVRELRWILFENVGRSLHVFVDIMEPVQALCDALEGE
jgi:hypothetical protein